jgi:hypothetical protein
VIRVFVVGVFDLTYLFYIIEYEKNFKRSLEFLKKSIFYKKMNELKNHLKNFTEINSKISSIENNLSSLKNQRNLLENNILTILENNQLTDKDIRFGNTKFQYNISEKKDTFTQQFIKNNLILFFKDIQNQSNDDATRNMSIIFDYLLKKRNTKQNKSLKIINLSKSNQS